MKILLISEGRCGSYSLLEWLSTNLNLTIVPELEEIFVPDDYVVKRSSLTFKNVNVNEYDYIIRLYREGSIAQSESNSYAIRNKEWHTEYTISDQYLRDNHTEIVEMITDIEIKNNLIKDIPHGLLITYEEIYIDGTGQEKLEKYLNFTSELKLCDDKKKTRFQNNNQNYRITRDLIIEKQKKDIILKDDHIKSLIVENTRLKEVINNLGKGHKLI